MSATIRQTEERMMQLLGHPDTERPTRHMRLAFLCTAIDMYAKWAQRTRHGHFVSSFTLPVTANTTDYAIPVDDFEGIYHALDSYGNDIDVINAPNADLLGVGGTPASVPAGDGSSPTYVGTRGIGEDRRITFYPARSTGTVTSHRPELDSTITALDHFHMTLLPVAAALIGMPHWHWRGMSMEEQAALKAGFLDTSNPLSFVGLLGEFQGLYKEELQNPNVKHPTARLSGWGARRRRMRGRGVRW
jgi:hypothetical protein